MTQIDDPVKTRFATRRRTDAAVLVLALSGELDLLTAPELEAALSEAQGEPHELLAIDLSQLTFMDSSGLAVLVGAKESADASGRRVVLRRPGPQVRRLLALVGLLEYLVIED